MLTAYTDMNIVDLIKFEVGNICTQYCDHGDDKQLNAVMAHILSYVLENKIKSFEFKYVNNKDVMYQIIFTMNDNKTGVVNFTQTEV
jgi:hypothetical protein